MRTVPDQGHDSRCHGPKYPVFLHLRRRILPCSYSSKHVHNLPQGGNMR